MPSIKQSPAMPHVHYTLILEQQGGPSVTINADAPDELESYAALWLSSPKVALRSAELHVYAQTRHTLTLA